MSKIGKCPTCRRLQEVKCNRVTCGHIWTPKSTDVKKCPSCNNKNGYTVVKHKKEKV